MEGKKTETASFRLEKENLEELRKEAEVRSISLNAYVNQIFSEFTNWHVSSAKAGLIPLPRTLLVKMIEKISDEDIVQLAEYIAKSETKDMLLMLRKENSPAALLSVLESWLKITNISHGHEINQTTYKCIMQHEMGKKWSKYFSAVLGYIFEELEMYHYKFDLTDNSLMFKLELNNRKVEQKIVHNSRVQK